MGRSNSPLHVTYVKMGFEPGRKVENSPGDGTRCAAGKQDCLGSIQREHKALTKYEMEFSGPSAYWMGNNEPKKDCVPILFMYIICVLKLVCCPQATKIVNLLRLFVEEVTTRV